MQARGHVTAARLHETAGSRRAPAGRVRASIVAHPSASEQVHSHLRLFGVSEDGHRQPYRYKDQDQ